MNTEQKLQAHLDGRIKKIGAHTYKRVAPHITCADGTTMSVQAGAYLYCSPRMNTGPWSQVEVGFPSEAPPESWSEYFDGDWGADDRTDSIYPYIPISLVAEYIDAHGGMR